MRFLKRLIERAAPAPVPSVEALSEDAIEASEATQTIQTSGSTDAEERQKEKERLRAILNCEEAKGREKLALHLAVSTDLSPAEAGAILSAGPRGVSSAPSEGGKPIANFFEQHRAQNAELWDAQPPISATDTILRIKQNHAAATGEPLSDRKEP